MSYDLWATGPGYTSDQISDSIYPDIREEMHNIIYGSLDVPRQGQMVVLREFNDIPCPACWDPIAKNSRKVFCAYCQGEGYQFTERAVMMAIFAGIAPVYKPSVLGTGQFPMAEFGATDPDKYTAYVEWNIYPDYDRYTYPRFKTVDKLYQLKVDGYGNVMYGTDGNPIRAAKWRILAVVPQRDNNARVGYFECALEKETIT